MLHAQDQRIGGCSRSLRELSGQGHWDNESDGESEEYPMKIEEARQRIESAMSQYGAHAGAAIDLVISEVKSDHGISTANELIEEFDLELQYNIAPIEPGFSSS